jgi:hypothetical protein
MSHQQRLNYLLDAFPLWMHTYIIQHWTPYLMTFMFNSQIGRRPVILANMTDELDRLYSTLVTRVLRNPHSPSQRPFRPILIVIPDLPVAKRNKTRLMPIRHNDGLHFHGILLISPYSRLKEDVVTHFKRHEHIYVKNRLSQLHIEPITSDLAHVIDYVFKSVKRRRFEFTDIVIFPKSSGE